ncbi:Ionotropic glutamate receptor, metazoa [Trema orientale]|uniref:Glutamate receptor n=1 Tax=Trema orientale TaxID=63057 RepID=A0A2P5F4R4_TREOI|nr:Ionotropic glutamate receptor, metazoa [Trema orientale]
MKHDWIVLLYLYSFLGLVILARGDHEGTSASVTGVVGAIVDDSCRVGKEERVAIKMALQDFHKATNQSLILHIRSSRRDPMQAALAARHLITRKGVQAILGPDTWEEISLVAKVGTGNQIPVLPLVNANPKWATQLWPFLVQISPNKLNQMKAIAAIVQSWEWYQVNVLYEDNSLMINDVLPHLSSALREVGAEITRLVALPPFVSSSMTEELERLKEGQCRVFIVHSSVEFGLKLFEKAREMKMVEKDYVWITTDAITNLVHSFNASTFSSMQGVLGVKSYLREDEPHWQDFYHGFRKRFSSEYPKEYNYEPGIFAVQAYDATWTLALAMIRGNKKGGQELLKQIFKSDFHGMSRKIQFDDRRVAPEHIFQIINVVGKGYNELGFWSDQFGFSETISKNTSYNSSMRGLGQVFWPGRPWYNPKGWTISTSSNPLKIGVPTNSLFKQFVNVEQGHDDHLGNSNHSVSGFAVDVFTAMVEKLPFYLPHYFVPFDGSYNELVEQIHLKKFDAVIGDVAIVAERYKHAEFTHPYTETGLVMVVPVRSKTSNKAWLFLKPFTLSMWVVIVAVNVYNGFVVWLIERNHCPDLKEGSLPNQIGTLFWLAFSTLFSLHGEKLHSNLSRMAMLVWLFVALVITQTYTANLTSMLTVQQLEPDVEALQSGNAMFGYCRGSYLESYLIEVLGFPKNKIKKFTSQEEYAQALNSREIAAVFLEAPLAKLFLARYCKGFTILKPTYKVGGFGFAFPRGSPLLPSINEALLQVAESGKLLELEKNMLESENCTDVETDNDSGPPSLSLKSFWTPNSLEGNDGYNKTQNQ